MSSAWLTDWPKVMQWGRVNTRIPSLWASRPDLHAEEEPQVSSLEAVFGTGCVLHSSRWNSVPERCSDIFDIKIWLQVCDHWKFFFSAITTDLGPTYIRYIIQKRDIRRVYLKAPIFQVAKSIGSNKALKAPGGGNGRQVPEERKVMGLPRAWHIRPLERSLGFQSCLWGSYVSLHSAVIWEVSPSSSVQANPRISNIRIFWRWKPSCENFQSLQCIQHATKVEYHCAGGQGWMPLHQCRAHNHFINMYWINRWMNKHQQHNWNEKRKKHIKEVNML